ncbi:UNVERIFIED_CONTAM: hypothetical protein K2H54_021843 [Gekko kuhli]
MGGTIEHAVQNVPTHLQALEQKYTPFFPICGEYYSAWIAPHNGLSHPPFLTHTRRQGVHKTGIQPPHKTRTLVIGSAFESRPYLGTKTPVTPASSSSSPKPASALQT